MKEGNLIICDNVHVESKCRQTHKNREYIHGYQVLHGEHEGHVGQNTQYFIYTGEVQELYCTACVY
jgi:hypothetical protein